MIDVRGPIPLWVVLLLGRWLSKSKPWELPTNQHFYGLYTHSCLQAPALSSYPDFPQ